MRPIDADALKEKIHNIWSGRPLSFLGARILATIDQAQTLEVNQPEWIPISEGPPKKDGDYLVYMSWDYQNVLMWADGWNCVRRFDGSVNRSSEIDGADIIAWMPLPDPYKEDGEDE